MRLLVRERLVAGDTDQQAIDYVVARYGNFVLLRPPFQADTWALWIAPFAILALASFGLMGRLKRTKASMPLSEAEKQRVAQLLSRADTQDGTR